MPVPSSITSLSQTAGSNSPAGSESPALIDDYLRALSAFIAFLRDDKASTTGSYSDPAWIASLSGAKLTAASVAASALAAGAAKSNIGAGGIGTNELAALAVTAAKLAAGAAVSNIGPGGITPSLLSTGAPTWDTSGNLQFNSGYGSAAISYGCRAWVNFNGSGTVAIRGSGNVSSITDNGVGNYTVNFTTAMPDANYAVVGTGSGGSGTGASGVVVLAEALATTNSYSSKTASSVQVVSTDNNTDALNDAFSANIVIFR